MPRSACKCDGTISEKCKCPSVHTGSPDGLVVSIQTSNDRRSLNRNYKPKHRLLVDLKEESDTNLVSRTLEDFYEKCAGYNLRYCSITGFVKHSDNYFRHMIRDVAVLICFVATNFVVFVAITSKTIVHMLLFFSIILQWIIRTILVKNSSPAGEKLSYSPRPSEQFEMQSASKTD